jgi:hypothetical protein
MTDKTVRRMRAPTHDELMSTIVPASEPVIFEGALDQWSLLSPPLSSDALLEKLAAACGKREIVVARAARKNAGLFSYADGKAHGQNFTEQRQNFDAFLDDVKRHTADVDGPALYMRSLLLNHWLPELLPEFELPMLGDQTLWGGSGRMWIGTGGHRVALHYDRDDNLLCMVSGRKRFMLYPPSALSNVYIGGFGLEPGSVATAVVDPLAPDRKRFPRFADSERDVVVAEIAAGDVLYLPAHWWHHVESFGLNVAVTFWWCRTTMEQRLASEAAFVHGLLSLRPLPAHLRSFYRSLFDYFVFETHGAPYAHVAESEQGWAGAPTPERDRELRKKLGQMLAGAGVFDAAANIDPDARYTLATQISFQFSHDGNVEVHGPFDPFLLPYELVEILREFVTPVVPEQLAQQRYPDDATKRASFERMCRALILRGLLVRCEDPR